MHKYPVCPFCNEELFCGDFISTCDKDTSTHHYTSYNNTRIRGAKIIIKGETPFTLMNKFDDFGKRDDKLCAVYTVKNGKLVERFSWNYNKFFNEEVFEEMRRLINDDNRKSYRDS